MLNQGNQAQGMVETKFGGMMKKDIEDMTIAEYMEYEADMKRQTWRNARSCFPTKHENKDINSLNHDKSRVLGYEHHFNDSNINAYYDLPPLIPCFKPVQPHTKDRYERLEKDTYYVSEDESETGEQRMSNDTVDDKPFTPKPQPEGEELSFDEDLDEWLKAEIEKHMCGQDKESGEDTLIHILKLLVGECKAVYTNKSTQIEASSHETNEVQGVSFVADDEEGDISGALPCQLPHKELNLGIFTLPCTIGDLNLYAMADLGASVNVMPKSIFEHLKLAN
ncbi:hypothetical protein Tco_0551667 [Tanacetum coccineum]